MTSFYFLSVIGLQCRSKTLDLSRPQRIYTHSSLARARGDSRDNSTLHAVAIGASAEGGVKGRVDVFFVSVQCHNVERKSVRLNDAGVLSVVGVVLPPFFLRFFLAFF